MLTLQRNKFTIAQGTTYLNCAYMSPLLKSVEQAGIKGMLRKRSPFKVAPQDFFTETELLRKEYAKLIQVSNPKQIVLVPSVSYGMANVINNLKATRGQNIVVAEAQFPSNYYPWHRAAAENHLQMEIVAAPVAADRGRIWNERILEAINPQTKAVALGHVHWADGTQFDLTAIRKRTREVGALLVIDGTQSVGALPLDVSTIQPDALICGGYKWLMGPYSLGLAYYSDYFNEGKPLEENWINRYQSENFAELVNYQTSYQPGALRYEVGEHSNFILVPMLLAAIKQINQWKPANIQKYCQKISAKAIAQLQAADFWIEDEAFRGKHLFGIRLPKSSNLDQLKIKLQKAKISVSVRGNAIRVSPHVYNTEQEMLKLTKVLLS